MQVRVVFKPWYDGATKVEERVYDVAEAMTIGQFLAIVAEDYPIAFGNAVRGLSGSLGVVVLVNGRMTVDMGERLSDGDSVGFTVPLSGG